MSNLSTIILALSMAFCWINFNKWIKFKPFNCMMCMTGWIAYFIKMGVCGVIGVSTGMAFVQSLLLWFVGCFAGAMFEAIKMRWL